MLFFKLREFAQDESGATSIEYALIASIISIVIVSGAIGIKTSLVGIFNLIASGFAS